MVAVCHLDLFGAYLDHPLRVLCGLYLCAKFVYDRCSSFNNMYVSIFGALGWKMPIHAPKIGVLQAMLPPKGGEISTKAKKAHPCVSPHHLIH